MVSEEGVFQKVKEALLAFFKEDHKLLHLNVNERSISHKLAEHIQKQFPRLNVDCEYNRHGNAIKRLNYRPAVSLRVDDLEAKTVFPDIVVHERGNDEKNLLVIEIKKSSSGGDYGPDQDKLKEFTGSQFRYKIGLFLLFDVEKKRLGDVRCFKGGEEVKEIMWANLKELGYGG